jgi:hypothetical protein
VPAAEERVTRRLLLLAALLAAAAPAHVPLLPPLRNYYGPLRICDPRLAFDVREGEGYLASGGEHVVRFGGRYLEFGRPWLYADESYRDIVRPLGTLALPGTGLLERIELSSRSSPEKVIVYLYDTGGGGPFAKIEIKSDAFDGSERDLALLSRILFGDRARAICAEVPEALRVRPEREDARAFWVRPDRPAGPLTLCWAGLALDLRESEAAIPAWRRDWDRFGVVSGGFTVAVSGRFAWLRDRAGRPYDGALAASPDFALRDTGRVAPGSVPAFSLGDAAAVHYVELARRVDVPNLGPRFISGVTFAFSGPATATDISAFVGRLRPQRAGDRCFEEAAG